MPDVSKTSDSTVLRTKRGAPFWLWFSVPIAVLAIAGSVIGIIFDEGIYSKETDNWAAQAIGQDIANLIAYPVLLLLAFTATRGSLLAYLGWTGALAYSVYSYAIYVFDIHFGPLFLVWVAVFGLSIYTLVGALASIDPMRVKASITARTPVRATSALLIGIGAIFYLLWLSEVVPAMVTTEAPQTAVEAQLPTNPVHVLDMAVFLPTAMLAGILLRKRRAWGYCLAPMVLGAMILISLGILSLMAVLAVRGEATSLGVAIGIGALAVVEIVVVIRFLRGLDRGASLQGVLRPPSRPT